MVNIFQILSSQNGGKLLTFFPVAVWSGSIALRFPAPQYALYSGSGWIEQPPKYGRIGSIFWIIMFSRNCHYLISAEVWQGLGGNFLAPAERGSASEEQRPARRSGAKSMSSKAPNYSTCMYKHSAKSVSTKAPNYPK